MNVIDLHCDALLRIQESDGKLSFIDNDQMHITYENLQKGGVKVQAFAIFIHPEIVSEQKYASALEQVAYFKTHVINSHPNMVHITDLKQIENLSNEQIGAFLTLESVECIGNDIHKLEHLLDEGVLAVGLTWNPANLACDGIGEQRNAGLSQFGREIIDLLNQRNILIDMSHISEQGFWDVMLIGKKVVASHSNVRDICGHRRNLTKKQIEEMIKRDFMIHIVYAPFFVVDDGKADVEDLLSHIAYIIDLGGAKNIGLGSDFDGIQTVPTRLENASMIPNLLTLIEQKFGKEVAEDIAYNNFIRHI